MKQLIIINGLTGKLQDIVMSAITKDSSSHNFFKIDARLADLLVSKTCDYPS